MKQIIFTILVVLSLCSWAGAASTTQPVVHIRDCAAIADTAVTIADGGSLYLSQLPAKWTLDYDFGLIGGHTVTAVFTLDGGKPLGFMQPPYCPTGHNTALFPTTAPVGSHAVTVSVNGASAISLKFNLANAPPAAPTSELATWGANYITAANSQDNNPDVHPILPATQAALHQTVVRVWPEYPAMVQQGDAYWVVCRNWEKLGYKIALQYQGFADQKNHGVPPSAQYIDFAKRVVAANKVAPTVWAVQWGNECNQPSGYFTGTPEDLTQMLKTVCPITHAAGILNIAPSTVNNLQWTGQAAAAGMYDSCDAADVHLYQSPGNILAMATQADHYFASIHKPYWISECGCTGATNTQQMLKYLAGFKAVVIPYSQLPSGNGKFASNVLTAGYVRNGEMFDAYQAGMGQ